MYPPVAVLPYPAQPYWGYYPVASQALYPGGHIAYGMQVASSVLPSQQAYPPQSRVSVQPTSGSPKADSFHSQTHVLAKRFLEALYAKPRPNEPLLKEIFRFVYLQKMQDGFSRAVQKARIIQGAEPAEPLQLLREQYNSSWVRRTFKSSRLKSIEDRLLYGHNTYRGSANEYRLYGLYHAVKDFIDICKKHPLLSGTLIGLTAYASHLWPVLGGVVNVAILGYSFAAIALNEWKASLIPKMNAEKARCYTMSGENFMGAAVTLPGADGIYKSIAQGVKVFTETAKGLSKATPTVQYMNSAKAALFSQLTEAPMGAFEKFRFVVGLLDNVLIPFNTVSSKLEAKKRLQNNTSVRMIPG
jgi:hypothetical protein